ncbi:MAG: DoxX family protein [Candidatus Omnitrophica bacterium]|nr:DoxX family protein [Candidatus Omnitrophota bacterium]
MLPRIALTILQVSLGVVFFVFGIGKFQNDYWARTMASMDIFQRLPWSPAVSVIIAGIMEVATGLALMVGFRRRLFAFMAAIQLLIILFLLSFQEIRDVGLFGSALFLACSKEPAFGFDYVWKRYESRKK